VMPAQKRPYSFVKLWLLHMKVLMINRTPS
jgi:hypothetical protein